MANYECENRISDDEIISSLEVIATTRNCSECKIRNCNWGDCNCSQITANAALDLINRQKTEVERLQKEVNLVSIQFQDVQERYEEAQTEIERLKHENNSMREDITQSVKELKNLGVLYAKDISKSKAEAIKEFWGKLKKHSRKMQSSDFSGEFWDRAVLVEDGDNLLKEMAVETE